MWKSARFRKHLTFFSHAHSYIAFFFFSCLFGTPVTYRLTNVRSRSATVGRISRIFNRGQNIIVLLASPTCLLWRVHAYTRSTLGAHHVTTDQCFSTAAIAIFRDFFRPFSDRMFCHVILLFASILHKMIGKAFVTLSKVIRIELIYPVIDLIIKLWVYIFIFFILLYIFIFYRGLTSSLFSYASSMIRYLRINGIQYVWCSNLLLVFSLSFSCNTIQD